MTAVMDRATKKNISSKKEKEEQRRIAEKLQARRTLHTISLEAPEYTIRPEILLKDGGYYEKEIRVGHTLEFICISVYVENCAKYVILYFADLLKLNSWLLSDF